MRLFGSRFARAVYAVDEACNQRG